MRLATIVLFLVHTVFSLLPVNVSQRYLEHAHQHVNDFILGVWKSESCIFFVQCKCNCTMHSLCSFLFLVQFIVAFLSL